MSESTPHPHPQVGTTSAIRRCVGWLILATIAVGVVALVGVSSNYFGPESSYRRGREGLIAGDRKTVARESDRLLATPGYEAHGCLLKGLFLVRFGKLDEAIPYLDKASRNKVLVVEASTAASRCFWLSGRYLEAIDAAHAALAVDATCLDARRWLAAAYYDLGAISHAADELEQISAAAPTDPRPDRLLGLIAKDSEQFVRAIEYYRKSLERDSQQPDRETILIELAESQVKLSRFAEALETLQECQRSAVVLTLQADCQSSLGHPAEAFERLREALESDRRYFPAKLAQGKLLQDGGKEDEAVLVLAEAVQWQPEDSQGHFQYSQALRRVGNVEQADAELRRMVEIRALEREFSDLHEKAATQPADAEIRYRIGELARTLGKPKLARVWFRATLAINPNHARARTALQELEAAPNASERGGVSPPVH